MFDFFKNKDVPPDVNTSVDAVEEAEKDSKDNEDGESQPIVKKGKKKSSVKLKAGDGSSLIRLASNLERVGIQIEALDVARGATNERFTRISEQIGELRSMIISDEKRMKSIDMNATKAMDLVNEVQPENLSRDVKKVEAKMEAIKARIEANEAISKDIMSELKKIRGHMSLFQGTEGILKLNDEVKSELVSIQKLKAITEGHAGKVEQIFLDVQKSFSEFERLKSRQTNIEESSSAIHKFIEGFKLKEGQFSTKKDFVVLGEKVNSQIENFKKELSEFSKIRESASQMIDITNKLTEVGLTNEADIKKNRLDILRFSVNIKSLVSYLKKVTKTLNNFSKEKGIKSDLDGVIKIIGEKKIVDSDKDTEKEFVIEKIPKVLKKKTSSLEKISSLKDARTSSSEIKKKKTLRKKSVKKKIIGKKKK